MQFDFSPAADGYGIWKELKNRGGLDLRRGRGSYDGYDVHLENELNNILFGMNSSSLDDNLKSNSTSSDDFLYAFLRAQKPFSLMLTDVLDFFERANARRGDSNLRIEFNFTNGKEFSIDLQHFREIETFFRKIIVERSKWRWSTDAAWKLVYKLVRFLDLKSSSDLPDPLEAAVSDWVDRDRLEDWSNPPDIPLSGDVAFDKIINESQRLRDAYYIACHTVSRDRRVFREIRTDVRDDFYTADEEATKRAEQIFVLQQLESDYWAKTFTKAVTIAAEAVKAGRRAASPSFVRDYAATLEQIDQGRNLVEEMQEAFRELLNLPIWQRRYELYAVWVGSRITLALDDLTTFYHTAGDTLRFPFSGAHLATLVTPESTDAKAEVLLFWTELRSQLNAQSGVGRKNIQPDYRIVKSPFDPEAGTNLVVECKQYRKSSLKNFGNAINDYARGCPNSLVILVNNGSVSKSVTAGIAASHSHRAFAIPDFRPDNHESLRLFKSLVRQSVIRTTRREDERKTDAVDERYQKIACLIWSAEFTDLDLIVKFTNISDGKEHLISYSNRGSYSVWPNIHLIGDVRTGPGEEFVVSDGWKQGMYDVFVHNFSDERCPAKAGVSITIHHPLRAGPFKVDGARVREGRGRYWHACRIDGSSGEAYIFSHTGDESILRS